jgi:hypothetical protein
MSSEVIITLPEPLAKEAQAEGLLKSSAIELLIKRELTRKSLERLSVVRDLPGAALGETEIQAEVDIVRAARRHR